MVIPVRGMRINREFKRYCKEAGILTSRTLHGIRHQSWIEIDFHTAEASNMVDIQIKKDGEVLFLNC